MKKSVQTAGVCLCSRTKTSEKCGVMVGVGRNRGCFKPPLSSRPALWFLSCCRERNAPAASRKKSQIERFFCLKNVGIEQRRKSWKGKKHYPLSLTAFDSFARRRRQPSVSFADVSLSREYPLGEPRRCLSFLHLYTEKCTGFFTRA